MLKNKNLIIALINVKNIFCIYTDLKTDVFGVKKYAPKKGRRNGYEKVINEILYIYDVIPGNMRENFHIIVENDADMIIFFHTVVLFTIRQININIVGKNESKVHF